jgi:hypothetical protein
MVGPRILRNCLSGCRQRRSRDRGDVATPFPLTRCRSEFSFTLLGNRLWSKTGPNTRIKSRAQFIRSHCGFYIVIPKANWSFSRRAFPRSPILKTNCIGVMAAISNWSHDPSNLFKPTEQNYRAKYLNTSLYPAKRRPGLGRDNAESLTVSADVV